MPKTTSKYEKPGWFDPSSYKDIDQLTLHDWWIELVIRNILCHALKNHSQDNPVDPTIIKTLTMLRENTYIKDAGFFAGKDLPTERKEWIDLGYITDAVRLLTNYDIEKLRSAHPGDDSDMPWNLFQNQTAGNPTHHIQLNINLNASDRVIKEDMEKLLKSYRKNYQIKSETTGTDAKINDWINSQLLPYMDIYIWSLENGINIEKDITYAEIARWIPPIDPCGDEKGRSATERGKAFKKITHNRHLARVLEPNFADKISTNFLSMEKDSPFNLFNPNN